MTRKQLLLSQKNLLEWYKKEARLDLPWRRTSNIYHIYLSEIMLQQTQVSRVAEEYYPRFLEKFPTLLSLSEASLDEVFSLWSGLGYYRRAKNLHESAKLCPEGLPSIQEELLKLPGIGKYTASAICSFAYKQTVSVVDTNISRVLLRFFAKQELKDKEVWGLADDFLNKVDTTEHNLALMDLGATVCVPKAPKCEICPLSESCRGQANPALYYKKKAMVYEDKILHLGIYAKENKIAMVPSTDGFYKNMLTLPQVMIEDNKKTSFADFKHSVTRFRLKVYLYKMECIDGDISWLNFENLESIPVSSLTQKALKLYKKAME